MIASALPLLLLLQTQALPESAEPISRAVPPTYSYGPADESVQRRVLERLTSEFEAVNKAFWTGYYEFETEEQRAAALAQKPDGVPIARRVMDLAELFPGSRTGLECITWALSYADLVDQARCFRYATKHHAASEDARQLFGLLSFTLAPEALTFLEAVHAHAETSGLRGRSDFYLAQHLLHRVEAARPLALMLPDELNKRRSEIGVDAVASLERLDSAAAMARAATLLRTVASEHPSLSGPFGKLSKIAKESLFELEHLSPGCAAPATKGVDLNGSPLSLADFRGKVVFLDFWGHW